MKNTTFESLVGGGKRTFLTHWSRFTKSYKYKFNGKELDEETGLYYYGARYYDSKASIWLSVDPLAYYDPINNKEHFANGEHNGGVYNSFNQAIYTYCYQNPIKYIDPNGKQTEVTGKGVIFNADVKNNKIDPLLNKAQMLEQKGHIRVNNSILDNAKNQKSENNATHIYSHGWSYDSNDNSKDYSYLSIYNENLNSYYAVNNSETFKIWLEMNDIDASFLKEKDHVLMLHSCRSAFGNNSLAGTLSIENSSTGLVVVGATGNVLYDRNGNYMGTASNGVKDKGGWNVYKNGKVIKTFSWDWKPNAADVKKMFR